MALPKLRAIVWHVLLAHINRVKVGYAALSFFVACRCHVLPSGLVVESLLSHNRTLNAKFL
jgi:hypothetical protein